MSDFQHLRNEYKETRNSYTNKNIRHEMLVMMGLYVRNDGQPGISTT